MEFSRVGEHTIKCVISEDEIQDLGFSVEEIVTNSERTQEFMNHIFDLAEQEFETKFEMGVKTVQVEFRSDHTLTLTFSEHPAAGEMLEHLKDIIGGLLNTIPPEKWKEFKERQLTQQNMDGYDEKDVVILLKLADLETAVQFAERVPMDKLPDSWFGKSDGDYYLVVDLAGRTEEEVKRLSVLSDEYVFEIEVGKSRLAHLFEHGQVIIADHALERLRELGE